MNNFLSEENIDLHREYVRTKRLKYSILESSIPKLKDATVTDLFRMRMSRRDKSDALPLRAEIELHNVYFSSFCQTRFLRCEQVEKKWGSCASFLNDIFKRCMELSYGFVTVSAVYGDIILESSSDSLSLFSHGTPMLAIDVCEHAYFADYHFDKERYLINALPYLDLMKISGPIK